MMNDVMMTRAILHLRERRIPPEDVTVRPMPFPGHIHGFVLCDPEGHYNIYLNSRDPLWRQYRALEHEIDHIASGDVFSDLPVDILEHLKA